jgi:hypothetical protein
MGFKGLAEGGVIRAPAQTTYEQSLGHTCLS